MNNIFKNNKRGQTSLTKTGILLVVIVFYTILFVLIGYINSYFSTSINVEKTSLTFTGSECDCGTITCSEYRLIYGDESYNNLCNSQQSQTGFFGFINNIISGITSLPWWLNTIIFGSLVAIIAWILLSSLPTFNGGG